MLKKRSADAKKELLFGLKPQNGSSLFSRPLQSVLQKKALLRPTNTNSRVSFRPQKMSISIFVWAKEKKSLGLRSNWDWRAARRLIISRVPPMGANFKIYRCRANLQFFCAFGPSRTNSPICTWLSSLRAARQPQLLRSPSDFISLAQTKMEMDIFWRRKETQ